MLSERLSCLPAVLPSFRPCPPAADRAGWERLPLSAKRRLLMAGEVQAARPVAPLSLGLWLDHARCGRRTEWEAAFFARRARLCALAAAECVEYCGRFLDEIADTLWAVCEESAWQLPAHNSYVRQGALLPLPDTARPLIDTAAAETGALVACVCFLLGPELEQAFPGLTSRAQREVRSRILRPYLQDHFWWMGAGAAPLSGWTARCTRGVLLAFFLLPSTGQEERRAAVRQAAYSLDCFLKGYASDGSPAAGPFDRAAALDLWGALHLLAAAAPDAFTPAFGEEKLRRIAAAIPALHVEGSPYDLNFGECGPLAGRCGAMEYLFARAVGDPLLAALAAADFAADPDPDRLTGRDDGRRADLWRVLLTAFTEEELRRCAASESLPAARPDVWYPGAGLFAAHRGAWVLGMRAGSNADAHNDAGSVTVYKAGQPFLIDVGASARSHPRVWTRQSGWHNLPTFGRRMQRSGASHAVRLLERGEGSLTADLAGAYPPAPGLSCYRRRAAVTEAGVTLDDATDWPGEVELTLMTERQPQPCDGGLALEGLGRLLLDAGAEVSVQPVPVSDPCLRAVWPDTLWKISVYFSHTLHMTLC